MKWMDANSERENQKFLLAQKLRLGISRAVTWTTFEVPGQNSEISTKKGSWARPGQKNDATVKYISNNISRVVGQRQF